ncbi:flavin reductase [Streptomyces sp. HUCO-GS316]|uniref:flavin reductase family protein n=1 Tax=Streptomyces sp. HUCO-GS316 TaxID=2692198 RepID=UPI00136FF8D6|nr:flavin reductase family protein [Streptomyces sp. HUCO-GS316]MXM68967.1 flavin reductase [Streptomyces sp. HUCO-GS316]
MTEPTATASHGVASADFRAAMAAHAAGVVVVTTRDADGRPWGLTATSFNSVSLEPPLVLVCVSRTAGGYEAFASCDEFAVSLLHEGQQDIAARFASRGADKFRSQDTTSTPALLPAVEDALCELDCRVHARHPAGDHLIVVGQVTHIRLREGAPLVHHDRAYRTLRP